MAEDNSLSSSPSLGGYEVQQSQSESRFLLSNSSGTKKMKHESHFGLDQQQVSLAEHERMVVSKQSRLKRSRSVMGSLKIDGFLPSTRHTSISTLDKIVPLAATTQARIGTIMPATLAMLDLPVPSPRKPFEMPGKAATQMISLDGPATRAMERASLSQPPFSKLLPKKSATTAATSKHRLSSRTMGKEERAMFPGRSLKRSQTEAFKLDDLVQATAPVEESIAFPSIEWNFDDDDDENQFEDDTNKDTIRNDNGFPGFLGSGCNPFAHLQQLEEDDDDEGVEDYSHRPKRICRGLVRSKKVESNLSSLADLFDCKPKIPMPYAA